MPGALLSHRTKSEPVELTSYWGQGEGVDKDMTDLSADFEKCKAVTEINRGMRR